MGCKIKEIPAPKQESTILAIDVCGTLFDTNTTAGFCLYHHRRIGNRWWLALIGMISRRGNPLLLLVSGLHRVSGIDLHRWLTIRSLRGERRHDLVKSATEYVGTLHSCRIRPVHELITTERAAGAKAVLVSNGLDIVISEIAERMSLPFLASQLRFDDDRCAGYLEVDLYGDKHHALARWLGEPLDQIDLLVITDNRSDTSLVSAARKAWIVHKGPRRSWMENLGAEFIQH